MIKNKEPQYHKDLMKKLIYLPLLYCLFVLPACLHSAHVEMPNNEHMEQLLQENPDSLATLLEEKINPNTLSDSDKADYARWLTKTHLKQNRSIMNDTLIHFAAAYYKKTASPYLLDACLLAAKQINWSGAAISQKEQLLNEAMSIAYSRKILQ